MDIRISSLVNMPLSRVAFALVIMMLEKAVSNSVVDNAGRLIGKPCVSANPLTKNAPTNERWLKSAQLFAFCFEKYGTASGRNASVQEKVCDTRMCKSCLYVCTLKSYLDEADCWGQCKTHYHVDACKRGCSFYLMIYGKNSTGAFNLSTSAAPSTLIVPKITSTSYEYSEVIWNQSSSASLVVYVIFSRVHYTEKTDVGEFKPTNLTMDIRKNITVKNICTYHGSAEHHLEVKFAYDVAAVSMHGYNKSTFLSTSKVLVEKGFKKVDYVTNISVPSPGVLDPTAGSPSVTYRVNWNVDKRIEHHVSYVEVSDRISGCGIFSSTDHPNRVNKASKTVNQVVDLANINLRMCNITFTIIPHVSCLQGVPKVKTILYRGCYNFTNAPAECTKPTVAPIKLPSIIANMTITNYICWKYTDSNCLVRGKSDSCSCANGTYSVTFRWDVPDAARLNYRSIKCVLFEIIRSSWFPYPKEKADLNCDKDARNRSIDGLLFGKQYSFKVRLEKSTQTDTLISGLQGVDFTITKVPVRLSSTHPGPISPTDIMQITEKQRTTTLASLKNKNNLNSSENSLPLTAGLVLAAIAIFVVLFALIILHRRKKRHGFGGLGQVSYQVDPPDHWELLLGNIVFGEALGEGAFGKVYCATVSGITLQNTFGSSESLDSYVKMGPNRAATPTGSFITMKAAVKLLQDNFTAQHKSDFLEEINLMKTVGHHKNIVNMLGCVTRGPTLCLVVEYMPNGDLLNFLRGRRSQILGMPVYVNTSLSLSKYIQCEASPRRSTCNLVPSSNIENEMAVADSFYEGGRPCDNDAISAEDLLRISWQVASGMEFLAKKGYVHRDLAARNVLVGPNKLCKISDFGLTRFVYEEKVYVGGKTRKLPIKWMSIEAIVDQRFTTFSDVWSFGVLLFEVVTLGGTPYPTMTGQELLRFLRAGNRMKKPENCSDEIFTVMKACWLTDPLSRPTFTDIKERFEMLISKGTPYVEFDIDATNPYYNVPSFRSIGDSDCASLADDMEEGEADWENRFRSLDRGFTGSFGDRYAAGNGEKHWLSAGAVEAERRERGQLDSASSDVSTTPLTDGIHQSKVDINELSLSVPLECGSAHFPKHNDDIMSRQRNGFSQSDEAAFTVDHYVNFDP